MRRLLLTFTAFFVLAAPAQAAWVWPVSGEVITPYRNGTDPYATGQHRGIDIAAPTGTAVVAAAGGEVRFAGTAGSSGLTISIRTGDGYDTSYLHLSSLGVRAGVHVSAGDRIGAVGTSGTRSAPAPHLHFGVRDAGTRHDYHDPLAFLPPPPPPAGAPDPPPPAPATAPEPAPPAAAPVTVPRAAPKPRAAPHARPRSAPRARPHAVPHSRPHAAPHPGPDAAPHPGPRAAPLPHPHVTPRASPHAIPHLHSPREPLRLTVGASKGRENPARVAAPSFHSGGREADEAGSATTPQPSLDAHSEHLAATPDERGHDLGWVAACAGLLLAAALLGLTEDGRRATHRTRSRVARALPLFVRR